MKLNNKNIVVTGASGGIASIVIKKIYDEGANIAMLDLNLEALKTLSKSFDETRVFYFALDVSNLSEVEKAFTFINSKFNNIDGLVNAAGIQAPISMFVESDLIKWKKNIEVNLLGTVFCTQHALKKMLLNNKGKIVNFSGGGSTSPRNAFSAYAVAKTAVVRFTETIAEELKENKIDINAIAPGAINTGMLEEVLKSGDSIGKEFYDSLNRKEKGGDDPNLAAELIAFLLSDDSDGISGKLISAPWDKWKEKYFQDELKNNKDLATLRRIDNKYFEKKL